MASCCVSEEPPWTTPLARESTRERAHRADDVDAEMVEEAPILGRDDGVDEVRRQLVEGHRIVVADAAAADLLAVAVEEGDREVLLLDVVVGDEVEGGRGEREQEQAGGNRDGESLAARLDADPLPGRRRGSGP